MEKITKKPWQSDTIIIAGLALLALVTEMLMAKFIGIALLDDGTRSAIFLGVLASVGFRFKTNTGIKFAWLIVPMLLLAGCATQTKSMETVLLESSNNGFPIVGIAHIEKVRSGVHIQLGPEANTWIKLFAGSDDIFANITFAPLGNDSFLWEHINQINAESGITDGTVNGRTLIRIDTPAYLGPLQ